MGDATAPRRSGGGGGGGGWQPRGRGRGYFRSNGSGGRFNGNQAAKGASASGSLPLLDSQGSQQVITDMLEVSQGPYSGWRLYHKQETEQRKRRSPNWGEAETQLLLRLWAERVQEMKTTKRNGFMLEEMAQMLQASGFSRSSTEVKTRIANLSQEYRMELRKRTLGFPHGNFKLWDAVHLILGSEENASANLSASFTSAEQQHFLNESWQAEQQATSQQGSGEGAESLCCDIDPGFRESSATVSKVRAAEAFIASHSQLWRLQEVEEHRAFPIDLRVLKEDEDFLAAWPHFMLELSDSPELTLACLGLAMHQTIVRELNSECARHLPPGETPPPIELPVVRARILGHEPIIQLKHLKSNFYSKLVTVRGTIIRVGGLKLLCTWLAFSCNSCGSIQAVRQPEGQFSPPSRCVTGGCRAKTFTPLHSNHLTQTTNWQTLKLQEIVDDDQREGGRVPRTLEVELTEDLVESCTPGDEVTVTGVVKVLNSDEASKKRTAGGPSMFQLYLDAVSLSSSKNNAGGLASTGDIKFNMQDYYAIQEIHSEPELFRLLVASLCPTIYGHEMVKAGLLLALFGGSPRPAQGSGRSDAHVLVVGDPGLGKSQMLQAVTSVAPRGVYVCGNTSSAAGLTVTLTRESGGDFALEAGALVLADQGCCCIDEFDKMSNQHQALLEAMEQQSVSVAKAGVVCSLPARASVLAAANPVGGHYNRAKTVAENLKLGPALLSRFDLVFILLDQPNEQMDSLLSDHIMALHSGGRKGPPKQQQQRGHSDSLLSSFTTDQPLSERLKVSAGENLDTIPAQLLRKYVAYARKYVRPKLSEAAAQVLQQFYLRLRAQRGNQDCTPVTTRQLESLIRLTEARAKLELREQATEDDARDVVELMKHSLLDTFCDELGSLDFQRSQNGSGTSSRSQAKKFVSLLQRRAELQTKSIFSVAELREVASQGRINIPDFSNFLSTLNHQGFLLKKGTNLYQLLSADY